MPFPALRSLDSSGRLRRLFSDSIVYGSASAVSKLLALITFPLLARSLSVAEYGAVDLFLVLANWLVLLVMLGVDSALGRLMADPGDDAARAQTVGQALLWLAGVMAIVVPTLFLAGDRLVAQLGQPEDIGTIVRLVALQLPLMATIAVAQAILRWTFQRRAFVLVSLGSASANALALVLAFTFWVPAPWLVFAAALAVQLPFAVLALVLVRRWLRRPRSLSGLRIVLAMAVPMGMVSCVAAALPMLERALVNQGAGAEALGLYAAGAKVAALLSLPIVAFQSGWTPFAVAVHREADAARTFNAALQVFTWLMCVLVLGLGVSGPWLISILATTRYAEGAAVILPLALALVVQGVGWTLEVGITVSKRMHLSLAAYAAMAAVFLAVGTLLMGSLGLLGVAVGMLAAQVTFATISALLAQRAHALPWRLGTPVTMLGATFAAGMGHALVGTAWGTTQASSMMFVALLGMLAWGAAHGGIRETVTLLLGRKR